MLDPRVGLAGYNVPHVSSVFAQLMLGHVLGGLLEGREIAGKLLGISFVETANTSGD